MSSWMKNFAKVLILAAMLGGVVMNVAPVFAATGDVKTGWVKMIIDGKEEDVFVGKRADGSYTYRYNNVTKDLPGDAKVQRSCSPGSKNSYYIKSVAECNVVKDEKNGDLMSRVNVIINVILGVLGVVTVAMIIIGGISYTTSQGDAAKASKAKNTILFGIVGLIISLLAFAIVNFVLSGVFGK